MDADEADDCCLYGFRRGERDVARRVKGQERFGSADHRRTGSSLDEIGKLIDWQPVTALLDALYSATKGELAWPPLAITPAMSTMDAPDPTPCPDDPGEVFTDSAYRGNHFGDAVRAKGGTPRIVATGCGGETRPERSLASLPGTGRFTVFAGASRKSSAPANVVTARAECDGEASAKPPSMFTSPSTSIRAQVSLQGMQITCRTVSGAVEVRLENKTDGSVTLAAGKFIAKVQKAQPAANSSS
jgi:hypothetical protein